MCNQFFQAGITGQVTNLYLLRKTEISKNFIFTRQSLWWAEPGPELNSGSPISESMYLNMLGDKIAFPQQKLIYHVLEFSRRY